MKTILPVLLLLLTQMPLLGQSDRLLGRVTRMQGKEVYVMCEPEREYTVVDKVNSVAAQLVLGVTPTLNNMVKTMLDRAVNRESKRKMQPFDAMITTDGNNAILIKFKEGNSEMRGVGRVNRLQGKEVYVMCEPLREYETVDKINSVFAQVMGVDPTIENMVKTMVDRAVNRESKNKSSSFDALITNDGENAILVKFKNQN